MRELPEPEGQLAWQTYTRDQVLAIQKQAYEDACIDFLERAVLVENPTVRLAMKAHANAMLTASQKKQK